MHINLLPFLVVWVALDLAVLYLFLRHRSLAGKQDAGLDVLETVSAAQQHAALAQQQAVIDRWGKALTAIAAVYGISLAVVFFYQSWVQMSNYGG